jgi:pimeloyl-ACP methyl ester carboxylesterase
MFGISWGGFNSIQMALRNPPALKAIIAVDATEDLYQEDVHFIDGIIHVDSWEMSQDLDNARPGAPDYRVDEAYFRDRFDTPPWMLTYKRQQRDGPFWDRASAKGRYDRIRIPSFFIGGWYDGYRDSIPADARERAGAGQRRSSVRGHTRGRTTRIPSPAWSGGARPCAGSTSGCSVWIPGSSRNPRFAVYVRQWHRPDRISRGTRAMALRGWLAHRAHPRATALPAARSHAA